MGQKRFTRKDPADKYDVVIDQPKVDDIKRNSQEREERERRERKDDEPDGLFLRTRAS